MGITNIMALDKKSSYLAEVLLFLHSTLFNTDNK